VSPSIRWRIAIPYVFLILVAMAGLAVYLSNLVRDAYLDRLEAQLSAEAQIIGDVIAPSLAQNKPGIAFDTQANHYADLLDARVTIIGIDGIVLGESDEDRAQMDNHLFRPEVQQALAQGRGASIRFSETVGYNMMYVAQRVTWGGETVGFARVALPLRQVEASVGRLRWAVFSAALLTAGGAALLAVLIAERTARPVRELTHVVQRMAEGDLHARLLPTTRDEVGTLTRAFNLMSDRLHGTITMLVEERGRLTAVMDNMADGVVITDGDGHVRLINPAAARILGADEQAAMGRSFAEVARDHRIIDLWQQCREECEELIELVDVGRGRPFLQVVVTPLRDAEPGANLVMLQDLTQVRRLETVRRDFISNISHELRTPLASLKALADTLHDGALEDPPAARRFLKHMEVEVDALAQMVQELLELSRIESGQVGFEIVPTPVADVVRPPLERLRPQAERADLRLDIDLPPGLSRILADAERVQQVITNLVHNAIKFTPPGGTVAISTEAGEDEIIIAVRDTGVGIPADDLPRIFERFYKADRARSGGGTGLGLAIAKHIVLAHGGRIWAESVEGRGSTFYVALPAQAR
jgi:two-component system phosphate regulon sensor histidine kinase PhoR